jgi:hypothetical protein
MKNIMIVGWFRKYPKTHFYSKKTKHMLGGVREGISISYNYIKFNFSNENKCETIIHRA